MNDLDLCLEVTSRSRQPLRYIILTLNISETVRDKSRDPTIFGIRSNISPKLLELETSNLVGGFILGMPSQRTNNFPESGRGLGHMTPIIFGSTVGYPSDSLASC